jgi:hypothetical protein
MLIVLLIGCRGDKWSINPDDVDLGAEFRVRSFHKDLLTLPDSDTVAVEKLVRVYGEFWADYSEDVLKLGPFNEPSTVAALRGFLNHPSTIETFAAIDTTSGSANRIAKFSLELENGFKRFHALMPAEPVPDVILMPSGFNSSVYPREDFIAVGLDMFIGHEHPILNYLPPEKFPQYRKLRMHPDLISSNAFRGWMLVNFADRGYTGAMLIEDILYWGKVLWLTDKCMPELHDHLLMDWTPGELAWAEANEESIWIELQPQDVLFEKNGTIYNRWLNEGPFTRAGAIPQESPDKLGIWMGWRMIDDYMNKYPSTSIDELFSDTQPTPYLKTYRP